MPRPWSEYHDTGPVEGLFQPVRDAPDPARPIVPVSARTQQSASQNLRIECPSCDTHQSPIDHRVILEPCGDLEHARQGGSVRAKWFWQCPACKRRFQERVVSRPCALCRLDAAIVEVERMRAEAAR